MSLKEKIGLYFSIAITLLFGLSYLFIYAQFSQYREQEFQERQKQKIRTTITFLRQFRKLDEEILEDIAIQRIHQLYNEKTVIYNEDKKMIYTSLDDSPILVEKKILDNLSQYKTWIEEKEGIFDVIGVRMNIEGRIYYGISKAHDKFGYSKLSYLKYVLLISYIVTTLIIILLSNFIAKKITYSIVKITGRIREYNFETDHTPLNVSDSDDELNILAKRFNELMEKMNSAFAFQKHAVHHISHELKTPLAVLVSNFERMEMEKNPEVLRQQIQKQKEDTRSLAEIITCLLDIAKAESGNALPSEGIRVDEMIFDISDELNKIYPDYRFKVEYDFSETEESDLILNANKRLINSVFMNLMVNCISYSDTPVSRIIIKPLKNGLHLDFISNGPLIDLQDQNYLFRHFFRGKNSRNIKGFGLGLVFIHKIIQLYQGSIIYTARGDSENIFTVIFPSEVNLETDKFTFKK